MARSLQLALQMRPQVDIEYILPAEDISWRDFLQRHNMTVINLEHLETQKKPYQGLWVDAYDLTTEQFEFYRRGSALTAIILDHSPAILDFDVFVSYTQIPSLPTEKLVLEGFKYALLNQKYENIKYDLNAPFITLSFGQVDSQNATSKVLLALEQYPSPLNLCVVIGLNNPHTEQIISLTEKSKHKIKIIHKPKNLIDILKQSKIFITAGGVSMLEACAAGIPCAVVITAGNQKSQVEALENKQAVLSLGQVNMFDPIKFLVVMDQLRDPAARQELSSCSREVVDGKGSFRLAERLLNVGANIRYD